MFKTLKLSHIVWTYLRVFRSTLIISIIVLLIIVSPIDIIRSKSLFT